MGSNRSISRCRFQVVYTAKSGFILSGTIIFTSGSTHLA